MKKYLLMISMFVLGGLAGCSGERRPEGFPKLYPCAIRLTQEGIPVAGIKVSLINAELTDRWAVGAASDDSGLAMIRTHGYSGAPKGRYKILLSKKETEGRGRIGDDHADQGWEDMKIWSLVAEKYENAGTTPLEIDVTGPLRESFEIGKEERRLVNIMRQGMP